MILQRNIKNIEYIYNNMLIQFPKNELKTFEQYKNLTSFNEYVVYDAIENEKQKGYIIIVENKKLKCVWIDYLAVFQEYQSQGYGHKILKRLKDLYFNYNGCFLEVEKPNKNNINTIRRVKFYEMQGAEKLPIDYYFPDYNEALSMDLYYFNYNNKTLKSDYIFDEIKFVFNILHSDIKNVEKIYKKIILIN